MSVTPPPRPVREFAERPAFTARGIEAAAAMIAHSGEEHWTRVGARTVLAYAEFAAGASIWCFEPPMQLVGSSVGLSQAVKVPEYVLRILLGAGPRVGPRSAWIADGAWATGGYALARAAAGLGEFVRADWLAPGGGRLIVQIDLHARSRGESDVAGPSAGSSAVAGSALIAATRTLEALEPLLLACYEECVVRARARRAALIARVPKSARAAVPLLVAGQTEVQIASALHKSKHTIHDYVKGVYTALNIKTRLELLRLWLGVDELEKGVR